MGRRIARVVAKIRPKAVTEEIRRIKRRLRAALDGGNKAEAKEQLRKLQEVIDKNSRKR